MENKPFYFIYNGKRRNHKRNLSKTITFLLFTYVEDYIKIGIVRKVEMDGIIQTFRH